VLINASMGDEGQIAERSCGCPLEEVGYVDGQIDARGGKLGQRAVEPVVGDESLEIAVLAPACASNRAYGLPGNL
jgi:hypothetical protein